MQHLQHYVLTLNPDAQYDWDRCTLRRLLSTDHPSLATLVQDAIGETSGQFLIAVELTVTVLEHSPLPEPVAPPAPPTSNTKPDAYATEPVPAVQTP